MPLFSHAIEEPKYEVIRQIDNVELRQYAPDAVADVVLDTKAEKQGNKAFPILAGSIFGKNKGERKFALTAPGMQAAVPGRMWVPVVPPEAAKLASAPKPLDPRVQLRLVRASQWATVRDSGTWPRANCAEHLSKLQAALAATRAATQGQPVLARCHAPMKPWFMRRNEVGLALR